MRSSTACSGTLNPIAVKSDSAIAISLPQKATARDIELISVLATVLQTDGMDCIVISPRSRKRKAPPLHNIKTLQAPRKRDDTDFGYAKRLHGAVKKKKVRTLVFTQLNKLGAYVALRNLAKGKLKLVYWQITPLGNPPEVDTLRLRLAQIDLWLCPTHATALEIKTQWPIAPVRLHVLPLPQTVPPAKKPATLPDTPLCVGVAFTSNVSDDDRALLGTLDEFLHQGMPLSLRLAVPGKQYNEARLYKTLRWPVGQPLPFAKEHVYPSGNGYGTFLQHCHVVMPAVAAEPYEGVALHAMLSGLVCLAPDGPATREWLGEGRGGALYKKDDPKALHEILEALCDPALRNRMGKAAAKYASQTHTISPFTAAVAALLSKPL